METNFILRHLLLKHPRQPFLGQRDDAFAGHDFHDREDAASSALIRSKTRESWLTARRGYSSGNERMIASRRMTRCSSPAR